MTREPISMRAVFDAANGAWHYIPQPPRNISLIPDDMADALVRWLLAREKPEKKDKL